MMNSQVEALNTAEDLLSDSSRWPAELSLGFASSNRGVVLKYSRHNGPLYIQKPFYPEGQQLAHVYLLHPPGGLVSGDKLKINVAMAQKAQALITTPGAGRVYRARSDRTLQHQQVTLELAENSTLEWLPQETIIYPGANTRLDTQVSLSAGARFIGWEITCLGLPENAMRFDTGQLQQCFQIKKQGRIALCEHLLLDDQSRNTFTGLAGFGARPINGLMIAGPFSESAQVDILIEQLRQQCNYISPEGRTLNENPLNISSPDELAGVSHTGDFLLIRYLGHSSEQARELFNQCWALIRPKLLGLPNIPPRIWAT
ncbi:urease accessory protein UreD [Amphritea sp. HPY]|uniref:urease accessory protein UreD n=1 Tax=Amphritea sp. HPY TaxID=3421652 RepID=UPI003D7C6687